MPIPRRRHRGDAAAATCPFRGDGVAAAATWLFRGDGIAAGGRLRRRRTHQRGSSRPRRYYVASLSSAHANASCHNFKDEGVQDYFGPAARDALADADAAFAKLPPPKPSGRGSGCGSSQQMTSAYYNRCNGCVSGESLAQRFPAAWGDCSSTSEPIKAKDIRKGDVLVDCITKSPAVVRCVVRTKVSRPALCVVGDVELTAWHPVRLDAGAAWAFPSELSSPRVANEVEYVYSVLFENQNAGYLSPSGVGVVALGHGLLDDPVCAHPFFGTDRIVDALASLPGFAEGRVDLLDGAFVKVNRLAAGVDPARVVVGNLGAAPRATPRALAPLVAC